MAILFSHFFQSTALILGPQSGTRSTILDIMLFLQLSLLFQSSDRDEVYGLFLRKFAKNIVGAIPVSATDAQFNSINMSSLVIYCDNIKSHEYLHAQNNLYS